MASAMTQPAPAANEMILTPVITLEGHEKRVQSLSYLQDGRQMVSVCLDKTVRRWDLQADEEIEEARKVCDHGVHAVAESRDGRWAITAGGDVDHGELKVSEVETGIVKSFQGHSKVITCIDISADGTLLASGSGDHTARLWNLDTGKLVAGPFESAAWVGAIRFSHNSKKLAVNSWSGENLEVWDVQTQNLDRRVVGKLWVGSSPLRITFAPVFWTNKETILAAFNFDDLAATTIYEFDASTLETVGAPFEGHTKVINSVALSFDGGLIASASGDHTIRLWAFESRQLLASFVVRLPHCIILSPDSRQITYTTYSNIYVCNTPSNILASIGLATDGHPEKTSATLEHSLDFDTCRPPAVRRNPATSPAIPCAPNLPITRDSQQHIFLRHLRKFLRFLSITDAVPPVPNGQLHDPLDATTQQSSYVDPHENCRSTSAPRTARFSAIAPVSFITRLSNWRPLHADHAAPPIVDVPLAQDKQHNVAEDAPKTEEDLAPNEYLDDPPSSNPNSQQVTATAQINTEEHGSDRSCFCL